MPLTKIKIVNLGLIRIGSSMITSLTEDTKQARAANLIWDAVVEAALEEHNWQWASLRVELAELSTEPEFGYEYAYAIPADCIRPIQMGDSLLLRDIDEIEYSMELISVGSNWVKALLTDFADDDGVFLRYLSRMGQAKNVALWPPLFSSAVAWRLAWDLAVHVSVSASKAELAMKSYKVELAKAIASDMSTRSEQLTYNDSWVDSR